MSLRVFDILGNSQRLDGGAMFGNAPRALWERWLQPDERGRIPLCCRAALVDTGTQKVLLETGIGSFFDPTLRERYGVVEAEHVLLGSLATRGLQHEDIDAVVLSHLHFDHAGGLLSPWEEGHPPRLLFPRARFIVGRTAFERARNPHPRDRASFIPEMPELLSNSGRLDLVEDDATELPGLGPAFSLTTSSGHTPGMLHTWLRGKHQNLFFCADLIPGTPWVNLPISMGYDRFPERLIDEKAALYPQFDAQRTWLFFTHDSAVSVGRLCRNERGKWQVTDETPSLTDGLDLDAEAGVAER